MRTSDVRKAALLVAIEMYEQASGQLSFTEFEVENFIGSFGITDAARPCGRI